jgi:hypothetical protein
MLLEGAIIFVMGVILTIAVGYYFLDIAFKLGFCVLALPIVIGLWPFDVTKDRLNKVLSIMIKASASFAFMAIITTYGISLIDAVVEGLTELYDKIESINSGLSNDELDALNEYIRDKVDIFSTTFILLVFSMYYFFSLVQEAIKTYTNHFFGDEVFGDKNPMHEHAKAATQKAGKLVAAPGKLGLDIAKTQVGNKIKGVSSRMGRGLGSLVSKPVNAAIKKWGGGGSGGSSGGSGGSS